ncbi:transposase [Tautonia sociabilis]|uniref:Transposase DDE domain-containing protein n=1 Tax=Tautonia sociabilis TaxID=2080755 RepID=A0A432MHK2_9BACT|nr:transposase [Tautonia sociabilis]RUL86827.1 hypothetical protein TsocGM_15160 [Tautonia sociabilis]
MSVQSVPLLSFDFLPARPVEIEVSPAPLTSDAGLLPVRQFDDRIRLTEQFATALHDPRDPRLSQQSLLSMVRQRVYGILADDEDQNDHDTLRTDPVFKLLADRLPGDHDLASQPTLSRFENAVSIPDLWRLRDVLVDLFIQSFDTPPHHLTLDLDAFDDPAHGQQQRSFLPVIYQAESWPTPQLVVIKVEAHAQGTNRRAVVINRPGSAVLPQAVYDEYVMRGESENRNKELKSELAADRLSDHRFLANFFRLYLHTAALNLLVRLRQAVVQGPPTPEQLGLPAEVPAEALDAPDRKRFFNRRRRRDPLGEGFACTWRTRLIKVAAVVITRARRVVVRLSESWPHLEDFLQVSRAVSGPPTRSPSGLPLRPWSPLVPPPIPLSPPRGGGRSVVNARGFGSSSTHPGGGAACGRG